MNRLIVGSSNNTPPTLTTRESTSFHTASATTGRSILTSKAAAQRENCGEELDVLAAGTEIRVYPHLSGVVIERMFRARTRS